MPLRIIPTMTQSERNDEVVRLLLRYDDTEQDLALLLARRDELATGLRRLADILEGNETIRPQEWVKPGHSLEDEVRNLPNLLRTIDEARTEKTQFEARIKAAGRERFIRS